MKQNHLLYNVFILNSEVNTIITNPVVLHIIDHMGLGGVQRLISGMVKSGYGDFILANRRKGTIIDDIPENVPLIFSGYSPFNFPISVFQAWQLIRKSNVNVVHCYLGTGVLIGLILSMFNKNVQFHFHEQGDILHGYWFHPIFLRCASKRGNLVVCSEYLKTIVLEAVPGIQVEMIHNFINHERFYPDAAAGKKYRSDNSISDQQFLIGFAGRLIQRKGWKEFLQAYTPLKDENLLVLIAGSGEDEKAIQEHINKYSIRNVRMIGQENQMRAFYNALDIFVMPSLIEPFGLTQLEAQACGIPVIASNIEGINETVSPDNCMLVDGGDVNGLRKAMQRLLDEPELRKKLHARGIENARNFTVQDFIEAIKKLQP